MTNKIAEISPAIRARAQAGEITSARLSEYQSFLREIETKFMNHRIILDNRYCRWFAKGEMNLDQLRHFVRQFSVFSHFFLVAQLKKMINAGNLESYRASKEILANEIGVIFHRPGQAALGGADSRTDSEKDISADPELVSTEGTVDG